ncbi:hypothetical protein PYW08_009142 [Mythimna loreyi]|uniref:Uncharacterized protein n=1 Tax=Mythimna loreyi TaxID=667449 RepID=A0ACC2Q8B0_9NEOP|nr:hypothetical protein PYW08_009142 [Mythimna loreyi]
MEDHRNCVMCRRGLYRGRYQQHVLSENLPREQPEVAAYIQQHSVLEVVFDNTRSICHRCWQRAANAIRPPVEAVVLEAPEENEQNVHVLHVPEYMRAPNNHRYCIFNNCANNTRHRIPNAIKVHIFCVYKLYIPDGARVCREHLEGNNWDELPDFCNTTHDFNAAQFKDVCDMLRTTIQRGSRLDFSLHGAMTDEEMHYWVSLNGSQFDDILELTPSLSVRCNDPRTALAILLVKLRTGDSDERLATLFNMSRRKLERYLAIARECLINEYIVLHLGVDHIDRENILARNLTLPKICLAMKKIAK